MSPKTFFNPKCPKWSEYWKDFDPPVWHSEQEWKQYLDQAGFTHIRIEKIPTMDPFIDRSEWLEWLKAVHPPRIPEERMDEYFSEFIDRYLAHDPEAVDKNGVVYAKFGRIELEAIKVE